MSVSNKGHPNSFTFKAAFNDKKTEIIVHELFYAVNLEEKEAPP